MGLSSQQLARLGELLDHSLPLSPAARRTWLETLPREDQPLVRTLRDALLADDPATVGDEMFRLPPLLADPGAANEPVTSRQAGERLGAYELLRPLGSGGMAEVWLARRADGAFERQVALKIPHLRDMPTEMAGRFARECHILATLEYPGIARLYDAGVDASGVPYIAMEFVQGEPLTTWCEAHGLDTAARIRAFLQVLDAVGHAHARQIIHRDLKPSNILVTGTGDVRLLDFGVARLLQAETGAPPLTRAYGRALTPEYASPELLRGEAIDQRSDIYSLGVVLNELLTGTRSAEPDRALRGALRHVVARAMAPLPGDRFPDAASFAAALQRAMPAQPAGARWRRARVLVPALIVVIAAGVLLYRREAPPAPNAAPATATATTAAAPTVSTIAVLPFVDLSERHDQAFLSDGLAEELLAVLTKVPELRVTARASSFAFRDRRNDIPEIARQLSVANILDGSVRKSGNRLRVTVQLVETRHGTVVWSDTYDRELKDVFKLQEDVAGAVVDALKLRLLTDQRIPPEQRTSNMAAYEKYLQGLKFHDSDSLEGLRRAKGAFEQSAALDPTFARAYAAIAGIAVEIGGHTVDRNMYELARKQAEHAIALSPRLAPAYVARAMVRMYSDWNFAGARTDLDQALDIDPNNLGVQQLLTNYLTVTGRLTEALAAQQRVVERNPLAAPAWTGLAKAYIAARDYPNARKAIDRADELQHDANSSQELRSDLDLYSGNYPEALRHARLIKDPHFRDFAVAKAAWSADRHSEAGAALQRLIREVPDVFAAQIALAAAWQGDRELAFHWLEHALDLHDPGLMEIQTTPEFDQLRDDPRYQAALQRMRLPNPASVPDTAVSATARSG